MKKLLFLILFFFNQELSAQDMTVIKLPNEIFRNVKKETDTSTWKWKRGGIVGANIAQGSLSNWAAGGDDFSMSINTNVNYYI